MAEMKFTIAGSPPSDTVAGRLISAEVETALNLPGRFLLVFADPSHDTASSLSVQLGSAVTLTCAPSPGQTVTLLTGEVTALEVEYASKQGTQLMVRGYDKLHRLQSGRSAKVFSPQSSYADVIRQLASGAGLVVGDVSGAPSSPVPWVGRRDLNDWELLLVMAEESGAVISMDGTGKLNFKAPTTASEGPAAGSPTASDSTPSLQLVPDNNLLRVRAVASGTQQVTSVAVRTWDPTQKQAVVGTGQAATTAVAAGSQWTPSAASGSLNGQAFVESRTAVPDQSSATTLATGLADRIGATAGEVEGVAILTPTMAAGEAVSLGNLGDPFDGKYVLTSVRHHFSARTGDRTFFMATGRQNRTVLGLTSPRQAVAADRPANRFVGVINGLVTDINDPNHQGRVKVKIPMWADDFVTDWARVVQQGTGSSHGAFLGPNVNDEVLVAFESNDLRRPVVLGGLYNGTDTPNLGDTGSLVNNGNYARRGITSTLGHMLVFFDDSSKTGVAAMTADKQYKVSLNGTKKQIAITVTESGGKVMITSAGDINISSTSGDVKISGNNISLQATQAFKVESNSGTSIQDAQSVAVKAAQITLN